MVKRSNIAHGDARGEKYGPSPADNTPAGRLEAARQLLDQNRSREAETSLTALIKSSRGDARLLARARVALSEALTMEGRSNESLASVAMYEPPESRAALDPETDIEVRAQLGLTFNYTGDFPKAIAILNAALRDAPEQGADSQRGAIYAALARVYRSINEYPIARDHSERSLDHYRRAGNWRGLAEGYVGLSLVDILTGNYESGLALSEQAVKLIGDRPAPFLLGKIYANMAGACWFLKRPHEGIRHLEKAINYYERAEHKANAAIGYNNLGINLTLVGRWERAHEALKRALELAFEVDERGSQVPMILDSLGELRMLRGELEDAQGLLERAVKLANENGNKWYAWQAARTLGHCLLATGDVERALKEGEGALALAEKIGDRQAVCESSLLLAEAHLRRGETEVCAELLQKVSELVEDSASDLALAGEEQRLQGLLATRRENPRLAAHHFGRSVSIFELLGDRYRTARAHFDLGRANASFQPERAAEPLTSAVRIFRELGARLDLARAEESLAALGYELPPRASIAEPQPRQLSIMRLVEAVNSRELMLRELASLIRQEAGASRVLVLEPSEGARYRAAGEQGFAHEEGARLLSSLNAAASDEGVESVASKHGGALVRLRVGNASPAALFVSPRALVDAADESLTTLLRLAEIGLDLCAFRERARTGRDGAQRAALAEQGLMPGFIHSSPAMKSLVEEIQKIRSSDVTVLVTGDSGTGKELVARAVHMVSSRRTRAFIPFNCTAVPKELSEGYLFGYRRGSFTGAVSDSPGVIRTAAGGTLFLDEIGDLPLDVQPKLLRFLQEGEIQPLGEQKPQKVDVRIIAATNTDLEAMVADGRFREDLYYRLNVIRLRVAPLRERRSEIPAIVSYYVNHYSEKFKKLDVHVTAEAVDLLMVFDWPGNVRQLTNEIQRIVARAEDGAVVTPEHLSPDIQRAAPRPVASFNSAASALPQNVSLSDAVEDLERGMIAEALRRHNGNVTRAARDLGLTRRGLQLKLGRYQIAATA
jgi:transcriptional regulator with GAF, ATPase, and Fis domain/tetratricopeptide (TPR) repeat protein